MISFMVKVVEIVGDRTPQRVLPEQNQPRQALLSYRTYPALRVRIQIRAPRRQGQTLHAARSQRVAEFAGEFPIAIMQKMAALVKVSRPFHSRVPCHLLHPARVRVPRYSAQRHAATANLDEEKDVVGDGPSARQHFHREKVGAREHVYVGLDKLLPGACATPLWRRCNLVSAQNDALI